VVYLDTLLIDWSLIIIMMSLWFCMLVLKS